MSGGVGSPLRVGVGAGGSGKGWHRGGGYICSVASVDGGRWWVFGTGAGWVGLLGFEGGCSGGSPSASCHHLPARHLGVGRSGGVGIGSGPACASSGPDPLRTGAQTVTNL